jgi:NAD(P)-dependent dehydrogenase (short-subunit alcohol dehydrogenase family)
MASKVALGRIASASEIVGTALYLASDASSYLTGELIMLDGG